MDTNMFCFQCEQTAGCSGCTGKTGVCGKSAQTAQIQDQLTGALIGLAHAANGTLPEGQSIEKVMIESLFATLTNACLPAVTMMIMTWRGSGRLMKISVP